MAQLTRKFRIPTLVCINKADINSAIADEIENDFQKQHINVIGRIRYDNTATQAQIAGQTIIEYPDSPLANEIKTLWKKILHKLNPY